MDSAVSGGIDTVLTNLWNYFFSGSIPTTYQDGTAARIQPVYTLGYGGAALAFFLSVAGAYIAGSTTIKQVENSFFAFLEDFQDNDDYISLMDADDFGQDFHDFLVWYSLDLVIMTMAMYWHVSYIIGMGLLAAVLLIQKVKSLESEHGNADSVPIDSSWTLLLFGVLWGGVDYIAGWAINVNKKTILKMMGFEAQLDSKPKTIQTTTTDPNGTTTSTFTTTYYKERKRDMFALQEIMEEWNMLFWTQRFLQIGLPYAYLGMVEGTVMLIFALTLLFY